MLTSDVGFSRDFLEMAIYGEGQVIGSLSNHDDDGDKNVTNLHI